MDKYFYILVGIIWLISNVYKSFQKKDTAKPAHPGKEADSPAESVPRKKEKSIETILEEILRGEQKPREQVPRKPKPPKHPKVTKAEKPSYSQETPVEETTADVRRNNTFSYDTPSPAAEQKKNAPEPIFSAETLQEESTLDLRSAIIYSEIIARPKYL